MSALSGSTRHSGVLVMKITPRRRKAASFVALTAMLLSAMVPMTAIADETDEVEVEEADAVIVDDDEESGEEDGVTAGDEGDQGETPEAVAEEPESDDEPDYVAGGAEGDAQVLGGWCFSCSGS